MSNDHPGLGSGAYETSIEEVFTDPANGQAAPAVKPRRKKRVLAAGAAVVFFASGVAAGTVLPDPTASPAYKSLAGERSTVEIERDAALSSYASRDASPRSRPAKPKLPRLMLP
ncbi:hypothetical protein QFZ35_002569 [Arthrobacter ulcerisalmonis]|nr:hypothetical protein [Arthrobacter ulcerisalmonis]MDQ0664071.1 hypothetical protein [Arthrobacter ulcerisalmonis]